MADQSIMIMCTKCGYSGETDPLGQGFHLKPGTFDACAYAGVPVGGAQVVPLREVVPPANASVVEVLESMLENARADRLSSVAIAVVYRDGSTGDAWSAQPVLGSIIGAVGILHARLIKLITRHDDD